MVQETGATVVVTATLTSVDQTTTQTGLSVTTDTIASIPKGRDMSSLAFMAPGVVGSGFGNDPSIGGGSGAENQYVLDGLTTTDFRRGFQGASLVTDFIDQVEIQTGGFKPEFSALGGVFNAVTKSGTNTTAGAAWLTWDARGMQAVPKQSPYFRQADPNSRYDLGASVGGAVIKDKWFYFVGADVTKTEAPGATPNQFGMYNDKLTQDNLQFVLKTNWYLTPDHQVTLFLQNNNVKTLQDKAYSFYGPQEIGGNTTDKTFNWNLAYDWTISPQLFFSAKAGATDYSTVYTPTDGTHKSVADPIWYTVGPGHLANPERAGLSYRYGGIGYYVGEDKAKTSQFRMDLSAFLGSHNLKFGISQVTSSYTEQAKTSGGSRVTIRTNGGAFAGIDNTILSTDATVKAVFNAIYAQDTWEVAPGFRLMYGFRYEIQEQKDLNDKSFMKFSGSDYVQPRLGFTWDVFNNGKSKLSGSYATYYESVPQRVAIRVYANEYYSRFRYGTSDSTYNAATGAWAITNPSAYRLTDYATPFSFDPIAEGVKLPQRQEYILGFDHTFDSGWTVGSHWKYRKLKNPIEDMVFTDTHGNPYDEGPAIDYVGVVGSQYGAGAAVLGNPGRFQQWKPNKNSMTLILLGQGETVNNWGINILDYYNPKTGLVTVPNSYYDKAGNTYYSADVTIDKKTERAYFSFSYTWARLEGNYEGVVSSSNGQADGNITASFDYFPYVGYGLLPLDRTHVAKIQASYRFDVFGHDLNAGINWTYQSGTPVSLFDDGTATTGDNSLDIGGYGNAVPANGQLGQYGRTPAINNVDVHLDYVVKFGKGLKVSPAVDVFNLFNTRYATGVLQQATDQSGNPDIRYGQANGWQVGRRFRFGVKLTF
jgi:hypothetical protein